MTAALALITGYLFGSLSGARIVGRVWAAGRDLSRTKVVLDGTGASVITRGVSSAALQARAGGAGGLRAAAIDILKALLPTLAARLIWPDGPEMFLVAAGGLIGHVYPVYYRFVGGFGISPLLGALLVIDWRAPLVAIAVFAILGLVLGSAYLGIETWPVGLVPWFLWQGDGWAVGLAVLANLLYWWRSRSEAIAAARSWKRDKRPWRARVRDFARYPDYEVPSE
jgi:glycerol-3-phosphate acyltransferase PlsY